MLQQNSETKKSNQKSGQGRVRSQVDTRFHIVFQYTSFLAGYELVLSMTKNGLLTSLTTTITEIKYDRKSKKYSDVINKTY